MAFLRVHCERPPNIVIELDGKKAVDYTETEENILAEGFIGPQIHANPKPVEVWFRELSIQTL